MRSQGEIRKVIIELCYMEVMNDFHKRCLGGTEEAEVRLGSRSEWDRRGDRDSKCGELILRTCVGSKE